MPFRIPFVSNLANYTGSPRSIPHPATGYQSRYRVGGAARNIVTLTLDKTSTVAGQYVAMTVTVTNSAQGPVPGVTVSLLATDGISYYSHLAVVVTDASGTAQTLISQLGVGAYDDPFSSHTTAFLEGLTIVAGIGAIYPQLSPSSPYATAQKTDLPSIFPAGAPFTSFGDWGAFSDELTATVSDIYSLSCPAAAAWSNSVYPSNPHPMSGTFSGRYEALFPGGFTAQYVDTGNGGSGFVYGNVRVQPASACSISAPYSGLGGYATWVKSDYDICCPIGTYTLNDPSHVVPGSPPGTVTVS